MQVNNNKLNQATACDHYIENIPILNIHTTEKLQPNTCETVVMPSHLGHLSVTWLIHAGFLSSCI